MTIAALSSVWPLGEQEQEGAGLLRGLKGKDNKKTKLVQNFESPTNTGTEPTRGREQQGQKRHWGCGTAQKNKTHTTRFTPRYSEREAWDSRLTVLMRLSKAEKRPARRLEPCVSVSFEANVMSETCVTHSANLQPLGFLLHQPPLQTVLRRRGNGVWGAALH